jgi:hypothetical protein
MAVKIVLMSACGGWDQMRLEALSYIDSSTIGPLSIALGCFRALRPPMSSTFSNPIDNINLEYLGLLSFLLLAPDTPSVKTHQAFKSQCPVRDLSPVELCHPQRGAQV